MWKQPVDPGFGEDYSRQTKRLINKDGTFNTYKSGIQVKAYDLYQHLANMSNFSFMATLLFFYLGLNAFFAGLYMWFGIENLHEADPALSPFANAFFFSVQTFTTVGYGVLAPQGLATNLVVTLESLLGWVGFAIITGLVYKRFSRPKARILYSNDAIVAPYQEGMSLQFRVANKRNNLLMEMEVKVVLMMHDPESYRRQYFNLKLERSSIQFFPLNWTIVHPIDEESPLWQATPEALEAQEAEILILLKGYDDTFGQRVHSSFSYRYDEIKWNVRFKKVYETNDAGDVILDLYKLHETEPIA